MDIEELLPDNFNTYTEEIKQNIIEYIKQLSPIEKKACKIAKNHLGSSFHILRSNGYIEWSKSK